MESRKGKAPQQVPQSRYLHPAHEGGGEAAEATWMLVLPLALAVGETGTFIREAQGSGAAARTCRYMSAHLWAGDNLSAMEG